MDEGPEWLDNHPKHALAKTVPPDVGWHFALALRSLTGVDPTGSLKAHLVVREVQLTDDKGERSTYLTRRLTTLRGKQLSPELNETLRSRNDGLQPRDLDGNPILALVRTVRFPDGYDAYVLLWSAGRDGTLGTRDDLRLRSRLYHIIHGGAWCGPWPTLKYWVAPYKPPRGLLAGLKRAWELREVRQLAAAAACKDAR